MINRGWVGTSSGKGTEVVRPGIVSWGVNYTNHVSYIYEDAKSGRRRMICLTQTNPEWFRTQLDELT